MVHLSGQDQRRSQPQTSVVTKVWVGSRRDPGRALQRFEKRLRNGFVEYGRAAGIGQVQIQGIDLFIGEPDVDRPIDGRVLWRCRMGEASRRMTVRVFSTGFICGSNARGRESFDPPGNPARRPPIEREEVADIGNAADGAPTEQEAQENGHA